MTTAEVGVLLATIPAYGVSIKSALGLVVMPIIAAMVGKSDAAGCGW
ncbi:MAG: hypothetical protein ACLP3R_23005 [Candidatus Korobacteraceae bacterium]